LPERLRLPYQDSPDIEPSAEAEISDCKTPVQYIRNIVDSTVIGYKYFEFEEASRICLEVRGKAAGTLKITAVSAQGVEKLCGNTEIKLSGGAGWQPVLCEATIPEGIYALYFTFRGDDSFDLRKFEFVKNIINNE
jgi:hypothetical protein